MNVILVKRVVSPETESMMCQPCSEHPRPTYADLDFFLTIPAYRDRDEEILPLISIILCASVRMDTEARVVGYIFFAVGLRTRVVTNLFNSIVSEIGGAVFAFPFRVSE